jgi:CelD/BcsL family acetyltransferase involved in cellulose biosynthesis
VFGITALASAGTRAAPDCALIRGELKRHRHVTLQLLWEKYSAEHGTAAYQRSAFCQIYREWAKRLKRSMLQRHFAGEKMFGLPTIFLTPRLDAWTSPRTVDNSGLLFEPRRKWYEQSTLFAGIQG